MNLLIDTHLLLWAAAEPARLPDAARQAILDPANALHFSVASLWEVAIKRALDRPDFRVDPGPLRAGLVAGGYLELPVEGRHVLALATLPRHHADPFDRMLLAQQSVENCMLMTSDRALLALGRPGLLDARR